MQLKEDGYQIFDKGFKVSEYEFISINPIENNTHVKVTISKRVVILYDKKTQSIIEQNTDGFTIDN